jgi:Resolvase, N terminal domain
MRIAIYGRVSTKKQDEMNQLLELRKFINTQDGWTLEIEYIDKVSGSGKKERPQFQRNAAGRKSKKIRLVVVLGVGSTLARRHREDDRLLGATKGLERGMAKLYAAVPRHRQRYGHWHSFERAGRRREARADYH